MKILIICLTSWILFTTIASAKNKKKNHSEEKNIESIDNGLYQRKLQGKNNKAKSLFEQMRLMYFKNLKYAAANKHLNTNTNANKNVKPVTYTNKSIQTKPVTNYNYKPTNNYPINNSKYVSNTNSNSNYRYNSNTQSNINTNNRNQYQYQYQNQNQYRYQSQNQNQNQNQNRYQNQNQNQNQDQTNWNQFGFYPNYRNDYDYFRNKYEEAEKHTVFKERIETWIKRLKATQELKDKEDQELFRMKNLEVNWKNRDILVQSVLNMERSIYSEQDKLASFYENQYQKEIDKILKVDTEYYEKNRGKLSRDMDWKDDIFQ